MFIEWKEKYSVGIEQIDRQHQGLIELLNKLHEQIQNKDKSFQPETAIKKLKKYILLHFGTEEKYFDLYNYPRKLEHKEEHRQFAQKVSELEERIKVAGAVVTLEMLNWLSQWYRQHVTGSDHQYAQYFKEKGFI
ncbi:MAG: hemerythrin family protein [Calditrichia bacterium]